MPRFVFAHQSLFNEAIAGRYRTFTSLPDEDIFIRFNALGVLAYYRAAEALRGIANIGVSSVVAAYLFDETEAALADVLRFNQDLAKQLNVERFFFNIRPTSRPIRWRGRLSRRRTGATSRDHEIDVTLGPCRMDDPFDRAIVRERPLRAPTITRTLESLDRRPSLLRSVCDELDSHGDHPEWQGERADSFSLQGHGARMRFIIRHGQGVVEAPVKKPRERANSWSESSGPPLDEVMGMLQRLLDLRIARDHQDIARLQHAIN